MSEDLLVLVVDDDEPSARLMSRYLDALGYACQTASSGKEALELMRANPEGFGMVLLDLAMPVMSGYEVCRIIRADPDLEHIPVVAITANVELQSLINATEAEFDDLITKPFTREDLLSVLEEHFGSR